VSWFLCKEEGNGRESESEKVCLFVWVGDIEMEGKGLTSALAEASQPRTRSGEGRTLVCWLPNYMSIEGAYECTGGHF